MRKAAVDEAERLRVAKEAEAAAKAEKEKKTAANEAERLRVA